MCIICLTGPAGFQHAAFWLACLIWLLETASVFPHRNLLVVPASCPRPFLGRNNVSETLVWLVLRWYEVEYIPVLGDPSYMEPAQACACSGLACRSFPWSFLQEEACISLFDSSRCTEFSEPRHTTMALSLMHPDSTSSVGHVLPHSCWPLNKHSASPRMRIKYRILGVVRLSKSTIWPPLGIYLLPIAFDPSFMAMQLAFRFELCVQAPVTWSHNMTTNNSKGSMKSRDY